MRLPWRQVARRVADDLRAGGPERRGVLDGVTDLWAALRRRRTLREDVLADIALLAGWVPATTTASGGAPSG